MTAHRYLRCVAHISALAALSISPQSLAQDVAIVSCLAEGADKPTLHRISEQEWALWDSREWLWKKHWCNEDWTVGSGGIYPAKTNPCEIIITDTEYVWRNSFKNEFREPYARTVHLQEHRIDRISGRYYWKQLIGMDKGSGFKYSQDNEAQGECTKIDDPSLQSKPKPKL